MQEVVNLLSDRHVITFLLLLAKISVLFAFFPFFSFPVFNNSIKAPLVLILTIVFYPIVPLYSMSIDWSRFGTRFYSRSYRRVYSCIFLKNGI